MPSDQDSSTNSRAARPQPTSFRTKVFGSGRTNHIRRGPAPRVTRSVVQPAGSAKPRIVRPAPRSVFQAPAAEQSLGYQAYTPDESFDGPSAGPDDSSSEDPSRHQRERQREDVRWQEQLPALKFHRACWLASETKRWQQVRDSLVSEYQSRISSAVSYSIPCEAEHSMTQDSSAYTVTIATLHGHVEVLAPVFVCSTCKEGVTLHPVSLGYFPATPSRAQLWYDHELLKATSASQLAGPTAIQAHCAALQGVYMYNGFGTGKPSIYSNLGPAAAQWRRVEVK